MEPSAGWKRFPVDVLRAYRTAVSTDPVAAACLRVLQGNLTAGGVVFSSSDKAARSTGTFQEHLDEHFVAFVNQALVELNLYGFCFFVLVEGDRPVALHTPQIDARWRLNTDLCTVELGVFTGDPTPDEDVFVIIDCLPNADGSFNSPAASYYRDRTIIDTFLRNAVTADNSNACPPVFTSSQRGRTFVEGDVARYDETQLLRTAMRTSELQTQEGIHINLHEHNSVLVESYNKLGPEIVARLRKDAHTGLSNFDAGMQQTMQRIIPLPLDATVAAAPRAVLRGDIIDHLTYFESLTCVAFGVNPESVGLNRKGGHSSAQTLETQSQLTRKTSNRWAGLLAKTLLVIYRLLWGETLPTDITVLFPSTVPDSVLESLFNQRILTWEAYKNCIASTYNLPLSALEAEDPRYVQDTSSSGGERPAAARQRAS